MNIRKNKYLFLTVVFFGVLYSLISLVNNYNFRTNALDLGAYTNALYDYIHFQWNDSTVFKAVKENLLADHFDLYLILFSPFSLIFKSYTLLLFQIAAILFGGVGVYRYFTLYGKSETLPLYAMLYFYLFFGVFSAVSSDYHSNVIAASLVPWFFCLLKQKKFIPASFLLLVILISKENISLWMVFICLGLLMEYRKYPFERKFLFGSILACALYFIMITTVVMPGLSNNSTYAHFQYSVLGKNFHQAIEFLVKHPVESLKTLFINHTNNSTGDYVKTEFHLLILLSGLPILLRKPQYLLMLIPVYFQKLFHDDYNMWGIGGQYSIEFAPVMAIGIFSVINDIKSIRIRNCGVLLALVACLCCTIRIMDSTVLYTNKSTIRFYKASHYSRDYDIKKVYQQLSKIPDDAIVSAQSQFLPHLAYRDNIYLFPMIKNAGYIVYSQKEDPYPMDKNTFSKLTFSLDASKEWIISYKDENITVLKKSNY